MDGRIKSLFANYLRANGLRLTPQRAKVLEAAVGSGGHFGAEELWRRLGGGRTGVSRATVYRALELLVRCGLVEKVRFGEEQYRFEMVRKGRHHDHLVCMRCGSVTEFYSEKIELLQQEICDRVRFTPAGHELVIFGVCRGCRVEKKARGNE